MVRRICGARLPEGVYCLSEAAQKKMARSKSPIILRHIRVARIEPHRVLQLGDCRLWLAQIHQRHAELEKRTRVVAVESYRRFQLDPRLGQSILTSAEMSHRTVRRRAVRITLE